MTIDAIVVGAGPNGLAAAITIARAGRSVMVLESADRVGGGTRSGELTLPGFVHDICSAIHPLAVASPCFRDLPLDKFGLHWIHADLPLAHPIADDRATAVYRSLETTAEQFGRESLAYRKLLQTFCEHSQSLLTDVLAPLHFPKNPWLMTQFGWHGIRSAAGLMDRLFQDSGLRGMFAGMAGHSMMPLNHSLTAAVGLMFCVSAHSTGWPFPRGGSEQIAIALRQYFETLGGEIVVDRHVNTLSELPPAKAILFDVTPRQLIEIAGDSLPQSYRRRLQKFRHGPGSFKLDWALAEPIPWKAEACQRAGTVHVGGTFEEIAAAEQHVADGQVADRPFVLVSQQSLFDRSRAPQGQHTGWGYCHVPNGCEIDMTERIESQIERFAPGFRDLILARKKMLPRELQQYNPNYLGGDISGGVMDIWQTFARPVSIFHPYQTPAKHVFLCSASTPPGPGVHGMCGWHAAQAALRTVLR